MRPRVPSAGEPPTVLSSSAPFPRANADCQWLNTVLYLVLQGLPCLPPLFAVGMPLTALLFLNEHGATAGGGLWLYLASGFVSAVIAFISFVYTPLVRYALRFLLILFPFLFFLKFVLCAHR